MEIYDLVQLLLIYFSLYLDVDLETWQLEKAVKECGMWHLFGSKSLKIFLNSILNFN